MDGRSEYASPLLNTVAGLQKAVSLIADAMTHVQAYSGQNHALCFAVDKINAELTRTGADLMRAHAREAFTPVAKPPEPQKAPPITMTATFVMDVAIVPNVDSRVLCALAAHQSVLEDLIDVVAGSISPGAFWHYMPTLCEADRMLGDADEDIDDLFDLAV